MKRKNPKSNDIEPRNTNQQDFEKFVQECNEAHQKILQKISEEIGNDGLVQELLRKLSELDNRETNYEMISYHRIINEMVISVQELKTATLSIKRFYQGMFGKERPAWLPNLKDSVLSATINWLGIYYAMDTAVVGKRIADFIRNKHDIIQRTWNELRGTLKQLLDDTDLTKELQTNKVEIQANADDSFHISVTLSEAQGGEMISYSIYPPQTSLLDKLKRKLKRLFCLRLSFL